MALSPIGEKLRAKSLEQKPAFTLPSIQALTMKDESLQGMVDKVVADKGLKNVQSKVLPGATISQGKEDVTLKRGGLAKLPIIGPAAFGSGKVNTGIYDKDTFAGQIERKGVFGFFFEGFKAKTDPTKAELGDRIFERYAKFKQEGIDEDKAIEASIQDVLNTTSPTARNVADLKNPGVKLTEAEEDLLFWVNAKENIFAVLDAPIFVGSTKPIKAGVKEVIETAEQKVYDQMKDTMIDRIKNQPQKRGITGQINLEVEDQLEEFAKVLQSDKIPTPRILNNGLELLRMSGRETDDLQQMVTEMIVSKLDEGMVAKKPLTGTPDAEIFTTREVPMKDVTGAKFVVPPGTVIKPLLDGNKTIIEVGGKQYVIPKNQYDNLKGQGQRAVATPFAPELEGTVETVKGAKRTSLKEVQDAKNRQDWDEFERLNNEYKNPTPTATKYSQYTLPGGENYREILVQAPLENGKVSNAKQALDELEKDGITFEDDIDGATYFIKDGEVLDYDSLTARQRSLMDTALGDATDTASFKNNIAGKYQSSHWSEPNVITHIRANERVDAEGQKHFFVEEIQSDWAREGREKGFDTGISTEEAKTMLPDGWKVIGNGDTYTVVDESGKPVQSKLEGDGLGEKAFGGNERAALGRALGDARLMGNFKSGVPNSPLLKNWQVTAIKRALIEAEQSGADRFTWINGRQTSERYNLATHVEEVKWQKSEHPDFEDVEGIKEVTLKPKGGGLMTLDFDSTGKIVNTQYKASDDWVGKKLDEVLGKGLADKIMEKEIGTLSGDGLSFGGEWASNLYDKQVRDIVKKLTGAEVETVNLGIGDGNKQLQTYKRDLENLEFSPNVVNYEAKVARLKEEIAKLESSSGLQTQQSIRLTPQVIARIKGEAPKFDMPPATAYGIPLIFTDLFDMQTAETIVEGATGLPAGYSEDEEGNITIDPTKAFMGMAAAGFLGLNMKKQQGVSDLKTNQAKSSPTLDAQDVASSRLDQRTLPSEISLPKAGQTQYPLSSPVFSDSLAKSYLDNTGTSIDDATAGLGPTELDPTKMSQYAKFRKGFEEAWTSTVEVVQDNTQRIFKLVQNPNVKVTDDTDPYLAELLFHGRVGARLTEASDTFVAIDKDIIDTSSKLGVADEDMTLLVNKYLHATHAPERNAKLGDGASGLTDNEASSILSDIENLPYNAEVKRIAGKVQEMNTKTLDILLESQVLDREAYDAMRTAYPNHVPLQRVLKEDEDMVQALTGKGFDVRSTGIKRAKGSDRQVADILANVVTNYEQAVIRAEKNLVDLTTLQFARDNKGLGLFEEVKPRVIGRGFDRPMGSSIPDEFADRPMPDAMESTVTNLRATIDDKWGGIYSEMMYAEAGHRKDKVWLQSDGTIDKITSTRSTFPSWVPEGDLRDKKLFEKVMDLHSAGKTPRGNATREKELLAVMEDELLKRLPLDAQDELALSYLARESETMASVYTKVQGAKGKPIYEQLTDPRILTLREKGKPVNLLIKDDKLAIAFKGINKQQLPGLMKFIGAFTRLYSGLQTRFNPEFAFPNKIRDLQEAVVYAGSRGELGFKGGVKSGLDQKAYLDVLDGIRGKDTEGARLYNQMIADGGTTGGMSLSTREAVELDIAQIRTLNRSVPRQAADKLVRSIDNFNTIFEDSTRLSLYKEALNRGVSRKRAAEIAKEASVNFNKFGTGGPILNALYMFSNASIQGTTKMIRAMKNPKVAAVVSTTVGTAVFASGEWNDRIDPDWRDKVTQYDRMNALILVMPKTQESDKFDYVAIPVGWGIKPIKVSMEYAYDAINGKGKGWLDTLNGIGGATINAYNPLGGTDIFSSVTPTIMDIPSEIARNKAWHGGKIMPDWDANAPDSIRYFSTLTDNTTGKTAIQVSEGLSGVGIEVSPQALYYAYQGYVGGAGRTTTDFVNTMITLGSGELPEPNDIPVWSRFVKQRDNEEIGAGSEEYEGIKLRLAEQSREKFYIKQDAENSYRQISALKTDEEKAQLFDQIAGNDPELAKAIAEIKEEEDLGVTYTQRLIKQLGVENGERALFVYQKLNQLETDEEKAELWQEYVEKKIISPKVAEQLNSLLSE